MATADDELFSTKNVSLNGPGFNIINYYRTDASIVPPFFHVKFVPKLGVGLYTGTKSDKKFSKSYIFGHPFSFAYTHSHSRA